MTPILLPLSAKSDIPNHGETRYLLRSALKYVTSPWLIIIGHRPGWLAVEKNGSMHIEGVGRVTHIACEDLPETNPDHNIARKVFEGCQYLKSNGHVSGFIRASDDNLFLAPYVPTIWVGDTIRNFIKKMDARKELARNTGSIEGLTNSYVERMRGYLNFMESTHGIFDYYNFDTHVPMWYLSPDSFIDFYEAEGFHFHQNKATINTAYYNSGVVMPLLDKNKELIKPWLPIRKGEDTKVGWMEDPVSVEFILKFMNDVRSPRWPLLGYSAQVVKGSKGKHFIEAIDRIFNEPNGFDKV